MNLTNVNIRDSYAGLITTLTTAGIGSILQRLQDGKGTSIPLSAATTKIKFHHLEHHVSGGRSITDSTKVAILSEAVGSEVENNDNSTTGVLRYVTIQNLIDEVITGGSLIKNLASSNDDSAQSGNINLDGFIRNSQIILDTEEGLYLRDRSTVTNNTSYQTLWADSTNDIFSLDWTRGTYTFNLGHSADSIDIRSDLYNDTNPIYTVADGKLHETTQSGVSTLEDKYLRRDVDSITLGNITFNKSEPILSFESTPVADIHKSTTQHIGSSIDRSFYQIYVDDINSDPDVNLIFGDILGTAVPIIRYTANEIYFPSHGNRTLTSIINSADNVDADTLDGLDSSQFVRSDDSSVLSGAEYTFDGSTIIFSTVPNAAKLLTNTGTDLQFQSSDFEIRSNDFKLYNRPVYNITSGTHTASTRNVLFQSEDNQLALYSTTTGLLADSDETNVFMKLGEHVVDFYEYGGTVSGSIAASLQKLRYTSDQHDFHSNQSVGGTITLSNNSDTLFTLSSVNESGNNVNLLTSIDGRIRFNGTGVQDLNIHNTASLSTISATNLRIGGDTVIIEPNNILTLGNLTLKNFKLDQSTYTNVGNRLSSTSDELLPSRLNLVDMTMFNFSGVTQNPTAGIVNGNGSYDTAKGLTVRKFVDALTLNNIDPTTATGLGSLSIRNEVLYYIESASIPDDPLGTRAHETATEFTSIVNYPDLTGTGISVTAVKTDKLYVGDGMLFEATPISNDSQINDSSGLMIHEVQDVASGLLGKSVVQRTSPSYLGVDHLQLKPNKYTPSESINASGDVTIIHDQKSVKTITATAGGNYVVNFTQESGSYDHLHGQRGSFLIKSTGNFTFTFSSNVSPKTTGPVNATTNQEILVDYIMINSTTYISTRAVF